MSTPTKAPKWERVKSEFAADVVNRYRQHCKRMGEEETPEGLLLYTIGAGLIYEADIGLYMVKALYPEALYRNNCRKMRAVYELESKLPLDERHIRRAIKCERSFSYEKNKNRTKRRVRTSG